MGFTPRAPIYKLREKNPIPRIEQDRTGNDRLGQSPMEVAAAGYEVIDRSRRADPFDPFGPAPLPSKAPADPVSRGADTRWDITRLSVGEL